MNKKQFFSFFNENSNSLSIENQVKLLNKIRLVWIPELISKKTKNYEFCPKCEKYIKKSDYIHKSMQDVSKGELVFQDCGYGEDDRYGDVTYLIKYKVCPNCRNTKIISRIRLKIENEHNRYGE